MKRANEPARLPRFKPAERATMPPTSVIEGLYYKATDSGEVKPSRPVKVSPEFAEREKANLTDELEQRRIQPPQWVYALIARGATPDEIAERMLRRLRRAPTRENFLLAKLLLEEMGRREDGGAYVRSTLSQRLVYELMAAGQPALPDDEEAKGE